MAKVTIILTDDKRGLVNCAADFDPPLDKKSDGTPAQHAAVTMLGYAMQRETSSSKRRARRQGKGKAP